MVRQVIDTAASAWAVVGQIYRDLFLWHVVPRSWLYRWLFRGENGDLRRPGELVLQDLAEFCHADRPTIFDTDPLIMARREGRREVFQRIQTFLNLDARDVRKIMEIDDGIGE